MEYHPRGCMEPPPLRALVCTVYSRKRQGLTPPADATLVPKQARGEQVARDPGPAARRGWGSVCPVMRRRRTEVSPSGTACWQRPVRCDLAHVPRTLHGVPRNRTSSLRHTFRHTVRHTFRHTFSHTFSHTDRHTDIQRQTETDRDRQRQTETDRDRPETDQRQTETDRQTYIHK